jgi:hypothetical protein
VLLALRLNQEHTANALPWQKGAVARLNPASPPLPPPCLCHYSPVPNVHKPSQWDYFLQGQ